MSHKVIKHGQIVRFKFSTSAAAGSRVDFSSALEAGDIRVYKNDGTAERSSTAGFTVTSGFDSMVGVHHVAIDTSDNTDAGFYVPGADYDVVLYPDETVDSLSVGAPVGSFSIDPRTSEMPYVGILQAAGSTSSITLPTECPATADELIGCYVFPLSGTGKGQAGRYISAYTSGRVATLDPAFTTALDTTTYVGIALGAPAPTSSVPTVKVSVGTGTGQINLASGKVPATIAAGDIANSAITAASIASDAITAAKVADGTIDAATFAAGAINAAAIASDAITAAKIAADAITAAKIADGAIDAATFAAGAINAAAIAADAIGASELATDAVTEIANAVVEAEITALKTYNRSANTTATITGPTSGSNSLGVTTDASYEPIATL